MLTRWRILTSINRHVLIQYLYTGTYCTLKWIGSTAGHEETIAKLKTGFEVYATARKYELDGLEELAKEQISLHSKGINAFTIVDVVNEAYPSSTDKDAWFPTYMRSIIKTAFEDSAVLLGPGVRAPSEKEFETEIPITTTLLRSALDVYHEVVETLAAKDASVIPEQVTPAADSFQLEDDEQVRYIKDQKSTPAEVLEEPRVEEPVKPAEPDVDPFTVWGVTKKSKKGKKKWKCSAVIEEPVVEEAPAEPEPMPEAGKEDGAAFGNTTGGGRFGGGTTGNEYRVTNNTAVNEPPGTLSVAFTPTIEKEANNPTQSNSYQNILFMDAYTRWSSEEVRLADYNQDRNLKTSQLATTGGFGSSTKTNAGGFGTGGFLFGRAPASSNPFGAATASPNPFGTAFACSNPFGVATVSSNLFGSTTTWPAQNGGL
ncbi:hypothetical protein B0H67DRAFT_557279 [Lasiosphaeris hirsuta]|uniref:Uncharacterized protein n=1 Tax=Lasiosphaeris hirsuta TaxID=260670 RepID=A0AA40DLR8_9PEZI|nr:hypothetical protein B0H67DRAFT_557279 [Lasiosphaeris hirsuta]